MPGVLHLSSNAPFNLPSFIVLFLERWWMMTPCFLWQDLYLLFILPFWISLWESLPSRTGAVPFPPILLIPSCVSLSNLIRTPTII